MSADIIDFASRQKVVQDNEPAAGGGDIWRCNCGTISFMFHVGGRIECCGCSATQNTGENGSWVIQQDPAADVSASSKEHDHLEF